MKKIITILLTVVMTAICALGFTGCTQPVANDAQTLEIYIGNFGYGYAWLEDCIDLFKEQSWVQEKYPNLNIPAIKKNSERSYANERTIAGSVANTVDLLFACESAAGYVDSTDKSGNRFYEDLAGVYGSTVPGEEITFGEKMNDGLRNTLARSNSDGSTSYYSMPWVNGYMGILYNKTLFERYMGANYTMPRTTDKFVELLDTLKGKNMKNDANNACFPLISASKVNYWQQIFMTWWAQYEGIDGYTNYWEGLNEYDETDIGVISQTGRLEGLKVLESVIGANTGHNHRDVNTLEFTQAQAKFLLGEGIFMPNGDWFENEMRVTQQENPYDYDITYMKMPVISSIVKTLEYDEMTDDELDTVVASVDAGEDFDTAKAKVAGLTQNDYDRIAEARNLMYTVEGHEAFVPSYATAKELAKDFLLFLATDEAIECFMITTNGCSTAFDYDMKANNETAYNEFMQLQKDRIDMTQTCISMPATNSFKLSYFGGLGVFAKTPSLETAFTAQNAGDRKTAQKIYDDDIAYYTGKNNYEWDALLQRAGLM